MRRMTVLTALMLALMLACACALPWGLPAGQAEAGPAQQADGTVLAVENRHFISRLYTLQNGQIRAVYEESRLCAGQERRIARVAAANNSVIFLRALGSTEWELVRLEDGIAQVLHRTVSEGPAIPTGLQVKGQTVWVTAIGDDGSISIYRWTEADGIALELLLPPQQQAPATAEYNGSVIRVTTVYGDHCYLSTDGSCTYSASAEEASGPALAADRHGWLLCKRSVLLAALAVWAVAAVILLAACLICRRSVRLSTRLTVSSGAALLLALLAAELLIALSVSDDLAQMWQIVQRTGVILGGAWCCIVLLLWCVARCITAPAARLAAQLDRVADGDTTPQEALEGRDELSQMDRSLQLMCMNLSVMEYESESTIRSYRRFVPEKMAELLERPVVEEIRLGDSRRMTGNVGIFSVGNRAEARNDLEDAAFVDFINHSFRTFHDSVGENHGCMMSSGLRLAAMEALFPDSAADGVRAGLDFLGKLHSHDTDAIPTPRGCVLLHKGSFLYSIAGEEDRLFPYLSSSELDLLSSFLPELDKAGARIIATEAYWSQLKCCGFTGRYIGFVSGNDHLSSYKLYEILDAYPQMERDLRKGYDARFQEAVNLFYRSDFYLARNLFSTLLRVCPGDGIARWYLFACEHLFHQEGASAPDYRLFGMKE